MERVETPKPRRRSRSERHGPQKHSAYRRRLLWGRMEKGDIPYGGASRCQPWDPAVQLTAHQSVRYLS
jgi:hypothetical protein